VAKSISAPSSGDIWHLSIEDLLSPLPETQRLGGPGPFVINLSASTAPISVPKNTIAGCANAHAYQIQRTEDRRMRYRLRLGPFATEDEAIAILDSVREMYPSALTATADTDDLRAIASMQPKADARSKKMGAAPAKADVSVTPAEKSALVEPPPAAPPPAAPTPKKKSTSASAPADATAAVSLAELSAAILDHSAAIIPPVLVDISEKPTAATAADVIPPAPRPIEAAAPDLSAATPTKFVPPPLLVEAQLIPFRPAATPASPTRLVPILTSVTTPAPAAIPTLTTQYVPPKPAAAAAPKAPREVVAPTPTPVALAPTTPASTAPAPTAPAPTAATPTAAAPAAAAPAAPVHIAQAPAAPVPAAKAPTAPAHAAPVPAEKAPAAPAHTAPALFPPPVEKPIARAPARETKHKTAQDVAAAAATASLQVEKLSERLPNLEVTQTVRPLTTLELEDGQAMRWFVIQLSLSAEPFDPDSVSNLDIFSVYRLYSVAGLDQGRIMHALRLGFFAEEAAAKAVASYLVAFYDNPLVKRVSAAERDRFAEQRLEARKDVGATGKHAVIEITDERYVRERRNPARIATPGQGPQPIGRRSTDPR
jgi:hypothetical protein